MSSTLVSGDLHLTDLPREDYRHVFMEKTLPTMLREHKCSRLILLGDITHEKSNHSAELVNRIASEIEALAKICRVVVLAGNHDRVGDNIPFFEFLNKLNCVTWISKPTIIGDEAFLPHTKDYRKDWKGLNFSSLEWVFAHQTFQGANVGPRKLEGIPLDYFPPKSNIISGDIHVPQIIKNDGSIVVYYVGAPYRVNYGDGYTPKIMIIEKGYLPKFFPVPGPKKVLLEIKSIQDLLDGKTYIQGDMLKIRVMLNQFEKWPEIKKEIQDWGDHNGYVIHTIPVISAQVHAKKLANFSKKSVTDQLLSYAERRGISDKVLKTGLTLMEK